MATRLALTAAQRRQLTRGSRAASAAFAARPGIQQYAGGAARAVQGAINRQMSPAQIRAAYNAAVAQGGMQGRGEARAYRTAFRAYGVEIATRAQ